MTIQDHDKAEGFQDKDATKDQRSSCRRFLDATRSICVFSFLPCSPRPGLCLVLLVLLRLASSAPPRLPRPRLCFVSPASSPASSTTLSLPRPCASHRSVCLASPCLPPRPHHLVSSSASLVGLRLPRHMTRVWYKRDDEKPRQTFCERRNI